MAYKISDTAAAQLIEIAIQGIELFGETQSRSYQSTLTRIFNLLSNQPQMGRVAKQDETYRLFPVGPHLILYKLAGDDIEVLQVIDGRSDFKL